MSNYNVKPIRLDFKPSRRLATSVLTAALIVSVAIACLAIPVWLKAAVILLMLASAGYHALGALRRLPRSCRCAHMNARGEWQLECNDGSVQEMVILPSSFVSPYLTVLNCSLTGRWKRYHIVILPDTLDAEAFRSLRVWLRWGYQASSVDAAGA